jgi:hypothetical protein
MTCFLKHQYVSIICQIETFRLTAILKSKLSTSNKFFIYKTILKPTWIYGIQLWGTVSTSNIEIVERFQSKALRMICVCRIRLSEGSPHTNS